MLLTAMGQAITAFSEAPCWALYGVTIRGYKGDKLLIRILRKIHLHHCLIEDDNGDLYQVIRARSIVPTRTMSPIQKW